MTKMILAALLAVAALDPIGAQAQETFCKIQDITKLTSEPQAVGTIVEFNGGTVSMVVKAHHESKWVEIKSYTDGDGFPRVFSVYPTYVDGFLPKWNSDQQKPCLIIRVVRVDDDDYLNARRFYLTGKR